MAPAWRLHLVFDAAWLTAVRDQRWAEVEDVLNAGEGNPSVRVALSPAPFTGELPVDDAAAALAAVGPVVPPTAESRPAFVARLRGVWESHFERVAARKPY